MPNIANILTPGDAPNAADRAVDAWRRIGDKPSSVTLVRVGVSPAAQTVRIEWDNSVQGELGGGAGVSSRHRGVIFGVRNHPTIANTDIKRDDRFAIGGTKYRVVDVNDQILGEVQATFEVSA